MSVLWRTSGLVSYLFSLPIKYYIQPGAAQDKGIVVNVAVLVKNYSSNLHDCVYTAFILRVYNTTAVLQFMNSE